MKIMKRVAILSTILLLISLIIYAKPIKAAITTNLTASSPTVESGKSFSIAISSSKKLSSWKISLGDTGGCIFSTATAVGGTLNGSTIVGGDGNGVTSLATYTFTAPTVEEDTTCKIIFYSIGMTDATVSEGDDTVSDTSCSATVTVKAKKKTTTNSSSSNTGNSASSSSSNVTKPNTNTNTTKNQNPTFKSTNQKVYANGDPTTNLRASWSTSSAATAVPKGTELTLTGTSSEKIGGYIWYRVTYKGTTKYIANNLITTTKPKDDKKSSNKNLYSLKIDGIEITPAFKKDITQYSAHVDGDVKELKISAKSENSKAKVSIEGNKGLKEGDNIIKVKVTAEDETTRTYFITVTKGEGTEVDTTLKLSELNIERVNFEGTFKPDVFSYELNLTSYVSNLEITAIPNQADAEIDISGNQDFKEGENVVIILLTSADGSEKATYQIKVNVPAEVIDKKEDDEQNTTLYVLIGVAVAVVIIAIIIIVRRKSERDDYEEDMSKDEEEKVPEKVELERVYRRDTGVSRRSEPKKEDNEDVDTRSSRNATLDDFLKGQDDDNEEKGRRGRGRHF